MTETTYIKDYIFSQAQSANFPKHSLTAVQGNDQLYHYLYLTTNNINNRYYIGIHSFKKPYDCKYRGSGKALKQAFKKYGRENFTTVPLLYFYNKLDLEKAEQIIITDHLIIEQNGKIYNLKSGGITGSINLQHSAFIRMLMSDKDYKQYWLQQVQFYKQHPELSKVKHQKETAEQKQERYRRSAATNKARIKYVREHEPEKWAKLEQKRKARMLQSFAKPVRVINLQTNEQVEYPSLAQAERELGFSLRSLIKGSTKSQKASLYKVEYIKECDANTVTKVEYKIPDYSSNEIPITAYDPFGNVVKHYKSSAQAIRELGLSDCFIFKTVIEKHYFVKGCFWDYTNESDRQRCNYQPQSKQRMVYACDENWNPIEFYVCMSDACRKYGFDKQTLKNHIQNKKLLKGKFWKWVNKQSETYVMNHQTLPDLRKRVGGSLKKDGDVVIEFESAQAASKYCNKCVSAVSTSIRTGWRCGGYYWRYLD